MCDGEQERLQHLLSSVSAVLKHHSSSSSSSSTNYDTDVDAPLLLAVALPSSTVSSSSSEVVDYEEWEDICRENGGWEFIDTTGMNEDKAEGGNERNEYGGMLVEPLIFEARIREGANI